MSDNYNIRDFRNAGLSAEDAAASDKSNKLFNLCVVAIPVIAALAGLGYKPLMELRVKNVAAVQQAEVDMEARRRAENPFYNLTQSMKDAENEDGLIDSSTFTLSGSAPSAESIRRNQYANRALTAKEFLSFIDAKAYGFTPIELETLKFERAVWAMTTCDHYDLIDFYTNQNKRAYDKVMSVQEDAKAAKAQIQAAKVSKEVAKAEKHFDQMRNIETTGQALAFVASGGAGRHMDAVTGSFGSMSTMLGDRGARKIRNRRQRFGKRGCSTVRTKIHSGELRVKTNVPLK